MNIFQKVKDLFGCYNWTTLHTDYANYKDTSFENLGYVEKWKVGYQIKYSPDLHEIKTVTTGKRAKKHPYYITDILPVVKEFEKLVMCATREEFKKQIVTHVNNKHKNEEG